MRKVRALFLSTEKGTKYSIRRTFVLSLIKKSHSALMIAWLSRGFVVKVIEVTNIFTKLSEKVL